jgi:hypothetical protein
MPVGLCEPTTAKMAVLRWRDADVHGGGANVGQAFLPVVGREKWGQAGMPVGLCEPTTADTPFLATGLVQLLATESRQAAPRA